jgi:hypothetical protein
MIRVMLIRATMTILDRRDVAAEGATARAMTSRHTPETMPDGPSVPVRPWSVRATRTTFSRAT